MAWVWAALLLSGSSLTVHGQAPGEKPPKLPPTSTRPVAPTKPKSPCPENVYQTACDSYAELVKAGDEGVKIEVGKTGVGVVCFRAEQDSFFVLTLEAPRWSKGHFDAGGKAWVPDYDATSAASGFVNEFVNGITGYKTMPVRTFVGEWSFPDDPYFGASKVNRKDADELSNVFITRSRVFTSARYKNQLDKNIDYDLTIQRSTGRFSERYTEEKAQTAFSESQGRCVVPPLK